MARIGYSRSRKLSPKPRLRTKPRKNPGQERSRVTVDAILDATARVLVKDGYDRASTNRVAIAAGVSIGSLYQYFPSKEALVAALVDRHSTEVLRIFETKAITLADVPLASAARDLIRATFDAHRVDPKLHRVFIEQVPRIGKLQDVDDVERRCVAMIHAYFEAHRREIRPKNLELAAELVSRAILAITHGAILRDRALDSDELLDEATDFVLRYLAKDGSR